MAMVDDKENENIEEKKEAPKIKKAPPKPRAARKGGTINIRRTLSHSAWIAHKDLLEFSRNRVMLVMLFVFPLFMMVMVGYIFPSGSSVKDMPVAIVNQDNFNDTGQPGPESIMLVSTVRAINDNSHFFKFKNMTSEAKVKEAIKHGDEMGALIIAANFTNNLRTGGQGYITVLYDQSNPTISAQISAVLDQLVNQIGTQHAVMQVNQTTHFSLNVSKSIVTPYKVTNKGTIPGNPSYFQFLAPGMMMLVVMMGAMSGLPRAIAYEKDSGTLDGVLVAPTSRLSIILGKVMAQTVRAFIQGMVVLLLAIVLFGVTIHGSILLVVFMLLLGTFSFIGLGIMITSVASDESTASTFMMVLQFPMMFLSGVLFPIQQMPWYMQAIAKVMPLTYAAQAMRKIIVLGAGIQDIMSELVILIVFGVVLLAISIPLFKRTMTK
jgi:ABC-2 type transport system permease protein